MSRTIKQILKDDKRSGEELGLVLMEKLKNQIKGEPLILSEKEIFLLAKKLPSQEELQIFSLYETIHNTVLNIYNFSRTTTFKFYASYNALMSIQDKIQIYEAAARDATTGPALTRAIETYCSKLSDFNGKTADTYTMMFDAVSFIEASNTYLKQLLSHFNISGLGCLQYNTEEFYILLDKLNRSTKNLYKAAGEREGEARKIFPELGEADKKQFTPDPRKLSEFKEFLRNETNLVIKNSFSFIMLLQNKKNIFQEEF